MPSSKILLIGIVLLFVGASLFLQKKIVAQDILGGKQAQLILPGYWSQLFGSTVLLEQENGGGANLLYDLFETPLMLLSGREPSTVICVYMFDIKYEVIVFDLGARPGRYAPVRGEEDLRWIVQGSEIPFRRASLDELRYVLKTVRKMSESDYKRASVPTVDLGWFRWYAPPERIATLMKEKLQEDGRPPQ